MLKYLIFFVVQIASCAYADVVFDVNAMKDPFPSNAVISDNGQIYANKGSSKISIYEAKSDKKFGSICCRKKKGRQDYVYLASDTEESTRLIYIEVNRLENKISSTISLYDIEANLISAITHPDEVDDQNISLSRKGKFFSLLLGENIHVYSSKDFSELNSFSIKGFAKISGMSVSERGDSISFVSENKVYVYSNLQSHIGLLGEYCDQQGKISATGFLGPDQKSVYVTSELGEVCLSVAPNNVLIKSPGGKLYGVLYDHDDNFLLLPTQKGLYAYDASTGERIGSFLVRPYYEKHFGKNKFEKPFLTSSIKYNPTTNIVLARGSVSTKTLYKIKLSRSAAN